MQAKSHCISEDIELIYLKFGQIYHVNFSKPNVKYRVVWLECRISQKTYLNVRNGFLHFIYSFQQL